MAVYPASMLEGVGEVLRQARQERNLTLEQAAQETHIRLRYLQAMEAGAFEQLPSPAHARGFLRAYAGYLGLDPQPLLLNLAGETYAAAGGPEAARPAHAPPAAAEGDAALIFEELGGRLRQQRELLGLSLEDVERHTHLRRHYLLALESGRLEELPSPVQGRGMLHNYAAFLGLDPEPLLLRFAEGLQAQLAARRATRPRRRAVRRPARVAASSIGRYFSTDFLLGGMLVLFLAGFVIWGAIRINDLSAAQRSSPTVPSIAEALMPELSPSPALTATASPEPAGVQAGQGPATIAVATGIVEPPEQGEGQPTGAGETGEGEAQATPPAEEGGGGVEVYLTIHQRAWVRVSVDGEIEFEGRMLPGSAYNYAGSERIEILTGNGAALQVFFNQQDLGRLGFYGEVVHRVFTPEGVKAPTPTITTTPTATLAATPTSRQTETPTLAP